MVTFTEKKRKVTFTEKPSKDYSKAEEMTLSHDWNTFYTGMLMKSELSLEDPDIEIKTYSTRKDQASKLNVIVSRDAQIHMHIWYSILKNDSIIKKDIPYTYQSSIKEKAKKVWGELIKITQELKKSETLILNNQEKVTSKELTEYGMTKQGSKAWKIKLDNSNRFVYLPKVGNPKELKVISCMLHYDDPTIIKYNLTESQKLDRQQQQILQFIYDKLDMNLPTKMKLFKKEIKDYLNKLFENPDLIEL